MKKIFHKVARYEQTGLNCGPNSLAQLLSFFSENFPPEKIIPKTEMISGFGVFDSELGITALEFGFKTRITTHNTYVFDPTWENLSKSKLIKKLQIAAKKTKNHLLKNDIVTFKNYLSKGGIVNFGPISKELLVSKLKKYPIIVGLSMTYLYGQARPQNADGRMRYGHFITINGYNPKSDTFDCTDPWHSIPFSKNGRYKIKSDKLITAIYLGEATYDCTVLEIWN